MVRVFHNQDIFGLRIQYEYANFGFKAIACGSNRKHGDRVLYDAKYNPSSKPKSSLSFDFTQNFVVQKAGNAIAECEDIWQKSKSDHNMAIALSDGATESSFAREWAKELVNAFVNRGVEDWLSPLQVTWQQWLKNQNLSWFAKRKAEKGAYATFLSLEIRADLSWQALAVGDSCLFVVRDHHFQTSFPLQSSHEFNNRPKLVGTHVKIPNVSFFKINGEAQVGDRFYLTTDAIACWIFKQLESNQNPWLKLDQISSQELFASWVSELRDQYAIANDDTTLLCLKIRSKS